MSLLKIFEILGLFFNTLNADDKYCLRNSENLRQPIQMQLSKKQNIFPQFFPPFVKNTWNSEHFETKEDPHILCIFEITDCKKRG